MLDGSGEAGCDEVCFPVHSCWDSRNVSVVGVFEPGPSSIENDTHGIEKLLLKSQVSEKFLHIEVNLIIQ